MYRNVLGAALVLLVGCSSQSGAPDGASAAGAGGAPGPAAGAGGAGAPTSAGSTSVQGGGGASTSAAGASPAAGSNSGGAGGGGSSAGAASGGAGADSGGVGGVGGGAGGSGGSAPTACKARAGATTLAAKYADCFPIGAAIDANSPTSHGALLKEHFNSVTPENEMKFDSLQHTEGSFTYTAADRIVDFARSNNMRIRGHALVWHRQNPTWLFSGASPETLLTRMKAHINAVMGHYKGKLYAWDVVNEAFMDDGDYRTGSETGDQQASNWYAIMGKRYIAEAFKAAHAADPDAKLFYNDFYNYLPKKQQGIYNMLKELLAEGVPVHGVGLQAHLNIQPSTDPMNQAYYQTVANMEEAIKLYASLGLEVQVTELDLSLYVPGVTYTQDTFYTAATFTDEIKAKQAARYREFFELFRKYSGVISGVTLWGVADDNTWLSEFSSGRKDFPLLFDDDHKPKKAYDAVMDF